MPGPGGTTYYYYIDYANGDDTTGTGTEGNPFQTIVKANQYAAINTNDEDDVYMYLMPGTHYINDTHGGMDYYSIARAEHLHVEGIPDSNGVFPRVIVSWKMGYYGGFGNGFIVFGLNLGRPNPRGITIKRIVFEDRCWYDPNNPFYYDYAIEFVTIKAYGGTARVEQCAFIGYNRPYQEYGWYRKALVLYAGDVGYVNNCIFEKMHTGIYNRLVKLYVKGCIFKDLISYGINYAYTPSPYSSLYDALFDYCDFYNVPTSTDQTQYLGDNNLAVQPALYSQEAMRVNGLYPAVKALWKASTDVDTFGSGSDIACEAAMFDYALGDCGDTVYIELDSDYTTIDIDADNHNYLLIGAVIQMTTGDDTNAPFIEYYAGSAWHKKILTSNLFYVFDSTLNIYEEEPIYSLIDMSAESNWTGTVSGIKFGGWSTLKVAQDPRTALLFSILPLAYNDVPDGRWENTTPTSTVIDAGDPAIYDSYVDGFGSLGRGTSRSDQGIFGGGNSTPYTGEDSERAVYLLSAPETNVRAGYGNTIGLLVTTRSIYCVVSDATVTTEGFTTISERLLSAGNMKKNIVGQALQRVACDSATFEFDNFDYNLYDENNQTGILYPKIFTGTFTFVSDNILRDTAQDLAEFTITGVCEILSGSAIGRKYFIIYNDTNSCTVLPDPSDVFSINPEIDGVKVGDAYRIDASYEIWAQIRVGFQNVSDRILWMGGYVNQKEIDNSVGTRSVIARILGFEKLLESYDAFDVSMENGNFYRMSGISPVKYIASNYTPIQYGIREVEFEWSDAGIEGIDIYEVQSGNLPGLKTIEYRPPYNFRYQDGPWVERIEPQTEYLYDADGNSISIKFSGRYPSYIQEMFFIIGNEYKPDVYKKGVPTLKIGSGNPLSLSRSFISILNYTGIWTDVTDYVTYEKEILSNADSIVNVFGGYGSSIYLLASEIFTGLELIKGSEASFNSSLRFEYSIGSTFYADLNTHSLVDNTNNFSQNGKVTWAIPSDWVKTNLYPNSTLGLYSTVYIIRITSETSSDTLSVRQFKKAFRVFDSDGLGVDFTVSHNQIPWDDIKEYVTIRKEGILGTWYNLIDYHTLATLAADIFGFPEDCREIDDMKYEWNFPKIGIWGQMPRLTGQHKLPTALAWDSINKDLYVGYQDELWVIPEKGYAKYLITMPTYNTHFLSIYKIIIINQNDIVYIKGVAWKPYTNDNYYNLNDDTRWHSKNMAWTNAPACAFEYNVNTEEFTHSFLETTSGLDEQNYASLYPGELTLRSGSGKLVYFFFGDYTESNHTWVCMLGLGLEAEPIYFLESWWTTGSGENLTVPFAHNNYLRLGPFGILRRGSSGDFLQNDSEQRGQGVVRYQGKINESSNLSGIYGDWYFQAPKSGNVGWEDVSNKGPFYQLSPGFYSVAQQTLAPIRENIVGEDYLQNYYLNAMWRLGQPGYVLWDQPNRKWISRIWDGLPDPEGDIVDKWTDRYFDENGIGNVRSTDVNTRSFGIQCGDWLGDTYESIYAAGILWFDPPDAFTVSTAYLIRLYAGGYEYVWTFNNSSPAEKGSSLPLSSYNMCIEIKYSPSEQVFHGCILQRDNISYHYMIFDPAYKKMYTQQISINPNYQIKSFAYHAEDQKMYFALCDMRYENAGALIMRATFDKTRDSGDWIHFEEVGTPDENEFDIPLMIFADDRIMGCTGPTKGQIFQIGTEFYPRASFANLGDLNGRELFEFLCEPLGMRMRITEDNKLQIKKWRL